MTLSIYDRFITDTNSGETIPGAIVTVSKISGGAGPAQLWQDKAGTASQSNPATASPQGRVTFYLTPGTYSIQAEFDGGTITYNDVIISSEDQSAIRDLFIDGVDFTGGVTTELTLSTAPRDIDNTIVTFDNEFIGPHLYSIANQTIVFNSVIPGDITRVYVWYGSYLSSSYNYSQMIELVDNFASGNITVFSELVTYTEITDWVDEGGVIYRPKPSALPIAAGPFNAGHWVIANDKKTTFGNVSEMLNTASIKNGDFVTTLDKSGDKNNIYFWDVVLASSVTANGIDIFDSIASPTLALVQRHPDGNKGFATVEQETKYTMPPNRHVFGEEYLWGFHKYVFDNNNDINCKFIWSGDSTTAGDNVAGYTPSFIGSLVSTELGLARHQHVNSGHSGKTAVDWDTLYLGQDIVSHPDMNVYVARWGINDGGTHGDVATYISAMDNALTNLRVFKGVEDLAIIVVSPSATYDEPNNRGTLWYESMIPALRKICRKHMAVFIDIYSIWQDAKQGAFNTGSTSTGKRWLDNPFGDGRGIHPDAAFACQIGLRITELIVKPALVKANIKNNQVINVSPDQGQPLANVQPWSYPKFIGCYTVDQSDGWPFSGKLRTTRNGTKVIQELFLTTAESTTESGNIINKKKIVRFGDTTTSVWSKWYNRAVAPGGLNGWATHNSQTQKYIHREDGSCSLEGAIAGGVDGTIAFGLPEEMWPTTEKSFITRGSSGFFSLVDVLTNGNVIVSKNGGTFCGLDGVVWTAGD